MTTPHYGFSRTLEQCSFEDAVARITDALKAQGFGVLTEIDVKATFKARLNADFVQYIILGACNPQLAHQALSADPDIGLLLPCNVVVRERPEGGVVIAIANPRSMFTLVDDPAIGSIAEDAEQRLRRALNSLD